jgi:hypothetical protein
VLDAIEQRVDLERIPSDQVGLENQRLTQNPAITDFPKTVDALVTDAMIG